METAYCDHCGEPIYTTHESDDNPRQRTDFRPWRPYSELPWDIASANAGESGVVCLDCVQILTDES